MSALTGYKTVTILGATGGAIGPAVVEGFLTNNKFKYDVRVVHRADALKDTRKAGLLTGWTSRGAKTVVVNSNDVAELTKALQGTDVVVSTLGGPALFDGTEKAYIKAAKAAGVKRFVTSHWGIENEGIPAGKIPFFDVKQASVDAVKAEGIEVTTFATATWMEYVFSPFLGFDAANGTALVLGDGKFNISISSVKDIGVIVSHAVQYADTANKVVRIATNTYNWNDLISLGERAFGKTFARTTLSSADLDNRIKTFTDFGAVLGATVQQIYGFDNKNVNFGDSTWEKVHAADLAGIKFTTVEEHVHNLAKAK